MPTKVLIQSQDADVGALVKSLLEPFGYETHVAGSVAETSTLARRHGPIDLVLSFDGAAIAPELKARLKEVTPDFKLLSLAPLSPPDARGEASDSGSFLLETTEVTDLIEGVLASAGGGPRRAPVTVESLRTALVETVLTYSLLLEQFGFINGGNSRLVMEYSVRVARELGLSSALADEVALAALLQDLGIVKARARERAKGRTEDDAAGGVEEHPIQSANLIQRMKLPWRIRHIVLAHHECYNGLGYPHGLRGREIPLGARILAVVNAFFSMISRRPNRAAVPQADACEELRRQAGRQFDPEVVEVFLSLLKDKAFHERKVPKRSVLIASGDPGFAPHAGVKLDASGIAAEVVATSADAIRRLREQPPDAVLLDTELADGNGFQVLHWMKQDERLARVPVLVVSADSAGAPSDYVAHDLGADDFLLKPVRPSTLVARLLAIIRRSDRVARAALTQIHDGEGLRGSLDELSVPDLVNLLHEGRKTATVNLRTASGEALLTFDHGAVVHARIGSLTGAEAFQRIYVFNQGDFVIEHGAATAERTISRRMDLLLSEAEATLGDAQRREQATSVARSLPSDGATRHMERPERFGNEEDTDVAARPAPRTLPADEGTDQVSTRTIEAPAAAR